MITRKTLTSEEQQIYDEVHRYPIFLSVRNFKELTGYSGATAYRLIHEGKLQVRNIRIQDITKTHTRITRESMLELMLEWNKG